MPDFEPWRAALLARVDARDAREKAPFARLFAEHAALATAQLESADAERELRDELERARAQLAADEGARVRAAEADDLRRQVAELTAERNELYRTQGQNAQRLLQLTDATRDLEAQLRALSEEETLLARIKKLEVRAGDLHALVGEKDGVITILKDELAAHQLELVTKDERLQRLDAENKELLDRWIKKAADDAERMNEANAFVERALKDKASSPMSVVAPTSADALVVVAEDDFIESARAPTRAILPTRAHRKISAHTYDINCIAVNSEGTLIATGGGDQKIEVFDASTGAQKLSVSGYTQSVMCVAFSDEADLLLGASNDNSTKIWSLSTGRMKHTLTGHVGKVYSARFAGGNRVVSGSHDRTLKVWDLAKGYCVKTIFTMSSCNDIALVDVAGGHLDNNIRLWDSRSGQAITELTGVHGGQVTSVEMCSDGCTFLSSSRDNTLKTVDLRTYGVQATFTSEGYRAGMNWARACFSLDGRYVAAGSLDGTVYIWNRFTRQLECNLREHASAVCGVVWDPRHGDRVYSAEKDKSVVLWSA